MLGIQKVVLKQDAAFSDGNINECLKSDNLISSALKRCLKLKKELASPICIATQINSFFDSASPIVSFVDDESNQATDEDIRIFGYRLEEIDSHIPKGLFAPLDF